MSTWWKNSTVDWPRAIRPTNCRASSSILEDLKTERSFLFSLFKVESGVYLSIYADIRVFPLLSFGWICCSEATAEKSESSTASSATPQIKRGNKGDGDAKPSEKEREKKETPRIWNRIRRTSIRLCMSTDCMGRPAEGNKEAGQMAKGERDDEQ